MRHINVNVKSLVVADDVVSKWFITGKGDDWEKKWIYQYVIKNLITLLIGCKVGVAMFVDHWIDQVAFMAEPCHAAVTFPIA